MDQQQSSDVQPVLIEGSWCASCASNSFTASNPRTGESLSTLYPVSGWGDLDRALASASRAFDEMLDLPTSAIAEFLRRFADHIESRSDQLVDAAATETALPAEPRLRIVELPRTTSQLRLAAAASEQQAWREPVEDTEAKLYSVYEPLGPVAVFGPNNFPFAFNGISGGDFAAAIAAGNPVIAKAHPLHPTTSRLLAEAAHQAADGVLPPGSVQMIYHMSNEDGLRLVADARLEAAAFTGSRTAGTELKRAADAVGKPIFLEMSSINPVVLLPGALEERFDALVDETATSALMGCGQFCTNPGLLLMLAGDATDRFIGQLAQRFDAAPPGVLLGAGVRDGLQAALDTLKNAGAELLAGGGPAAGGGFAFENTLLRTTGESFLAAPAQLQTEAFGNSTLAVVADDVQQAAEVLASLEGNLTGCIYSSEDGNDEAAYALLARVLRRKVGRLLNDKMPTGVAVSPAMNHGGPFPATGHPHFTAVGIPASLRRFTRLACYDNVRAERLPSVFRK